MTNILYFIVRAIVNVFSDKPILPKYHAVKDTALSKVIITKV